MKSDFTLSTCLMITLVNGNDNPYPVDSYPSVEPTNSPNLQYDAYPSVEPSITSNLEYDAYPNIASTNTPIHPDGPYPLETPNIVPTACPNFRGDTFSLTYLPSNTPSPQRRIEVETVAPQLVEVSTKSPVTNLNTCAPNGEQCALPFFPGVICCSGCCINFGTFSECNDASFCGNGNTNPTTCLKEGEICGFLTGTRQECCSGLCCKASFGISSCVTC